MMDKTFAAYLPTYVNNGLMSVTVGQLIVRQRGQMLKKSQIAYAPNLGATQLLVFGSLVDTGLFDGRSDIEWQCGVSLPLNFFKLSHKS
ncbi:MAG: hypothetical protein M5U34_12530 [Chloroflexi bacterium]|nr:hypothetical protein [Chloroflexota bacterium]